MVYCMSNVLNKQQELQTTAFGEASVAEPTPVIQVSAHLSVFARGFGMFFNLFIILGVLSCEGE